LVLDLAKADVDGVKPLHQIVAMANARIRRMKLLLSASLVLGALVSGCAVHYDISTFNGQIIRASSKPKLDEQGYYLFKDGSGQVVKINKVKVRKIEAVSPGDRPSEFNF
jgi:hypothetical protein